MRESGPMAVAGGATSVPVQRLVLQFLRDKSQQKYFLFHILLYFILFNPTVNERLLKENSLVTDETPPL